MIRTLTIDASVSISGKTPDAGADAISERDLWTSLKMCSLSFTIDSVRWDVRTFHLR